MENLIAEGRSLAEEVNVVNYEETVDKANEWLQKLEGAISDKAVTDEIYQIAARVFKPKFINANPFLAAPIINLIEEKIVFFQQKVGDIIDILLQQNTTK